jgi:hypothetical protein
MAEGRRAADLGHPGLAGRGGHRRPPRGHGPGAAGRSAAGGPRPVAVVDLSGVAALAFTSVNGVAAFARLHGDRDRPVFAVGDRTARAAREAGFADVASADGDVEALAALILGQAARLDGAVLHPCALEPAGDLVSPLVAAGLSARRLAVYETVDRDPERPRPWPRWTTWRRCCCIRRARRGSWPGGSSGVPRRACGRCACRRRWPRRSGRWCGRDGWPR